MVTNNLTGGYVIWDNILKGEHVLQAGMSYGRICHRRACLSEAYFKGGRVLEDDMSYWMMFFCRTYKYYRDVLVKDRSCGITCFTGGDVSLDQMSHWIKCLSLDQMSHWIKCLTGSMSHWIKCLSLDQMSHWIKCLTGSNVSH